MCICIYIYIYKGSSSSIFNYRYIIRKHESCHTHTHAPFVMSPGSMCAAALCMHTANLGSNFNIVMMSQYHTMRAELLLG